MRFLKTFLLGVILFLLGGCKPLTIQVGKKELPKWYLTPQSDNYNYFYATGSGDNKQEAITNALNMIASKISVEVSSEFNSMVRNSTIEGYSRFSQKNINLRVQRLKFNNYKILKTQEIGDKIYLLLRVDKQKMANALIEEISIRLRDMDIKKSNFNGSNYRKLKLYEMLAKEAKEIKADFLIANSISPKSYRERFLRKIDSYIKDYIKLKNSITFYIQNRPKDADYAKVVANFITKKGFNLTNKIDDNTIIVDIDVNEQMLQSFGNKILKANILVKLKDKNSYVENFSAVIGGTSRSSYILAKQEVLNKFAKKIEEEIDDE